MTNPSFDIDSLARKIEQARNSEPGAARTSFDAVELAPLTDILESAFRFHESVPAAQKPGIVWRAVVAAADSGAVTGKTLSKALAQAHTEWLGADLDRWSVVTRLSLPWLPEMNPVRVGRARIQFYRWQPKRYSQEDLEWQLSILRIPPPDPRFVWVRTSVLARNSQDAFHRAADALDFLRGLMNFRLNRRKGPSLMTSGPQPAINSIRPGPIYSVHDADPTGTPLFWYDECDRRHERLWRNDVEWDLLLRVFRDDRKALYRTGYRKKLRRLFIRYARALDSNAWEFVIVRLWAILEAAVGTDVNAGGPTIRRTIAMIRGDRRLEEQLLRHLQLMRHGIVHHDAELADAHKLVTRLKIYVELILNFHLRMGHEFSGFEEAVEFLNLGRNVDGLRRRRQLIDRYLALPW